MFSFKWAIIFSGDTFATHAKLHKHGMLPLPIIIPETDLKYPVIDIDLEVDNVSSATCVSACFTPQTEPNHSESSLCSVSQSLFTASSQTETETEIDDDVSEDEDDDGDEDELEGENSQQKKKGHWCWHLLVSFL